MPAAGAALSRRAPPARRGSRTFSAPSGSGGACEVPVWAASSWRRAECGRRWSAGAGRADCARSRRSVRVIPDAEAAYHAALGDAPGVLILAGTGSMALGRDARGRWARAGGLGPLLGDEGSAYWIGREWLRTSSRGEDFALARRILASPEPVARIAALAPGVLRRAQAGSPRARAILRRGQQALADLLLATARKLRARPPVAVSWSGSLLDAESYRAGVWRAARRLGLDITPLPAQESAADAALRLAAAAAGARERAPASARRTRRRSKRVSCESRI